MGYHNESSDDYPASILLTCQVAKLSKQVSLLWVIFTEPSNVLKNQLKIFILYQWQGLRAVLVENGLNFHLWEIDRSTGEWIVATGQWKKHQATDCNGIFRMQV